MASRARGPISKSASSSRSVRRRGSKLTTCPRPTPASLLAAFSMSLREARALIRFRLLRISAHLRIARLYSFSIVHPPILPRRVSKIRTTRTISVHAVSVLRWYALACSVVRRTCSFSSTTSWSSAGVSTRIAAALSFILLIRSWMPAASVLRASRYLYCTKNFSSFARNLSTRSVTFHTPKACISWSNASISCCCLRLSTSLASSPWSAPFFACLSASTSACLKSSSLSCMSWSKYSILLFSSLTLVTCSSASFPPSVTSTLHMSLILARSE
mmetsp:Transcript_23579/g.58223  ORF Transcript_23579/g.58223 Transcript_23579/m.58223 type:complete len:273 (-) Transcript_23579:699-1517(-)